MMKRYSFLWIGLVFLVIAFSFDRINMSTSSPGKYVSKLEKHIHSNESVANALFNDENRLKKVIYNEIETKKDWENLKDLSENTPHFYIFENDSLIFWSNNEVIPYSSDAQYSTEREERFIEIKGNYYELIKESFELEVDTNQYTMVSLIPIYYGYPVENSYLQSHFAASKKIPTAVRITKAETNYPVKNLNDQTLFHIEAIGPFIDYSTQVGMLFLFGMAFIFLCAFFNQQANILAQQYSPLGGLAFLFSVIMTGRLVLLITNFFTRFRDLDIFEPYENSMSILSHSIGEFLFNAILVLWVVLFYFNRVQSINLKNDTKRNRLVVTGLLYFLTFLSFFTISFMVREMILSGNTYFDFSDIFSLGTYSFSGILGIVILLTALFLFTLRSTLIIQNFQLETSDLVKVLLITFGVSSVLVSIVGIYLFNLLLLSFATIYTFLFDFFIKKRTANFTWLVTWLFTYAVLASGLLYIHNNERETRESMMFARSLANENDVEAENRFCAIEEDIRNDNFVKQIDNIFIQRSQVVSQINNYLSDTYFINKYDYTVHIYNSQGIGRMNETTSYNFFQKSKAESDSTSCGNLFFWSNDHGDYNYLAELNIQDNGRPIGIIYIQFIPKRLDKQKVYPELLIDEKVSSQKRFAKYDYAIYQSTEKMQDAGFNYPAQLDYEVPVEVDGFSVIKNNKRKLLTYNAGNEKFIIVGKDAEEIYKPMSLFSYMFCFLAVFVLLLALMNIWLQLLPSLETLGFEFSSSLRSTIQTSVIAVIVLTFVVIGLVTVIYFRVDSDEYHASRLSRKARAIAASAQYEIRKNAWDTTYLPDVSSLSLIHKMDINLYDLEGSLLESSQREIYDEGLLSKNIPIVPFLQINKTQTNRYYHFEKIGNLNYRSAYMPLMNVNDQVIAYLGLPYYSEQSDLRNDVSDFMGTLLNVYVFLLLVSGVAAILMANNITKPLVVLGEKLKQVGIGKKNEQLDWDSSDEIGALIEEYNKMIEELDKSADKLAKSEREGAWREMAKQVAHEIKNPLTPMKLRIQFLTRAFDSRPEAIGPVLKEVAKTLIEQIDALSRIATEFSNFAKMPKAENEFFILNDLVGSVHSLFQEGEEEDSDVEVTANLTENICNVYADKEQIGRVLNNVIKNAIQAIPDDREGKVHVDLIHKKTKAIISIEDNGCGIPDDQHQAIFVPNFTTKNSGTGLGLAMSKNIIDSIDGRIYFETTPNVGTTFYIEIPLISREEADEKVKWEFLNQEQPEDA